MLIYKTLSIYINTDTPYEDSLKRTPDCGVVSVVVVVVVVGSSSSLPIHLLSRRPSRRKWWLGQYPCPMTANSW
jgi:hypothetical protein